MEAGPGGSACGGGAAVGLYRHGGRPLLSGIAEPTVLYILRCCIDCTASATSPSSTPRTPSFIARRASILRRCSASRGRPARARSKPAGCECTTRGRELVPHVAFGFGSEPSTVACRGTEADRRHRPPVSRGGLLITVREPSLTSPPVPFSICSYQPTRSLISIQPSALARTWDSNTNGCLAARGQRTDKRTYSTRAHPVSSPSPSLAAGKGRSLIPVRIGSGVGPDRLVSTASTPVVVPRAVALSALPCSRSSSAILIADAAVAIHEPAAGGSSAKLKQTAQAVTAGALSQAARLISWSALSMACCAVAIASDASSCCSSNGSQFPMAICS